MKPQDAKTFEDLRQAFITHDESDTKIHSEMRKFIVRMEPVIKVFEDNKIAEAVIENKTKKITFYIREATTIGTMILVIWGIIKYVINR